jgi:hypothetical protein
MGTKSNYKGENMLNTINVVELSGGVINSIRSFDTSEEGIKEAETLFKKILKENFPEKTEEELEDAISDGFSDDDYDLQLIWAYKD